MVASGRRWLVYGAGGHGVVVLDALLALKYHPAGFLDDGVAPGTDVLGFPVFGGEAWLENHPDVIVALGIGSNSLRHRVAEQCAQLGIPVESVVHPGAIVSSFAAVGPGAVVLAGAVVNARARLGIGCIVNSGAIVEHDAVLGDFAHASPNSTLAGGASLGEQAQLGASACILPGIRVGAYSIVGAGAVVSRDVAARCVVAGVPARFLRPREVP